MNRINEKIDSVDKHEQVHSKTERNVVFLNCHFFKGTKCAQVYTKLVFKDIERADALVNKVMAINSKVDVLVLAEVWGSKIRDRIIKRTRPRFPYSWFPKLRTSPVRFDSGLLFVSRMPITASGFRAFEELSGWDSRSTKGVGYIVAEGVAYMGTHFDSSNKTKTSTSGAENRMGNLTQTLNLAREIEEQGIAQQIILCGDFNIREQDLQNSDDSGGTESKGVKTREYLLFRDRLEGSGFRDALRELFPDAQKVPCNTTSSRANSLSSLWGPSVKSEARIDYFFTKNVRTKRSGVYKGCWAGRDSTNKEAVKKELERPDKTTVNPNIYQVSDHYPIWATFNIRQSTG